MIQIWSVVGLIHNVRKFGDCALGLPKNTLGDAIQEPQELTCSSLGLTSSQAWSLQLVTALITDILVSVTANSGNFQFTGNFLKTALSLAGNHLFCYPGHEDLNP